MKTKTTKNIIGRLLLSASLVATLAFANGCATNTDTADQMKPMKGAEHLMMLSGISTLAQADDLKPGDTVVMVCAKCQTVSTQNVTVEKGHIRTMTVGAKHLCSGCGSTITVVGVGKGKHDLVKHVCDKCGSDSAFCCATKPGSNATEGMEKK